MLRAACSDRDGSVFLEAAIVIPVLLTLVLGALEFSWFFYQRELIAAGLRDAARYLAKTANPGAGANLELARHLATSGQISGGAPRVSGFTDATVELCVASAGGSGCPNECTGDAVVLAASPCGPGRACRGGPAGIVLASTSFPERSLGFFHLLGLQPPTFCLWHEERMLPDAAAK
jgi:hypothetical protein